MGSEGLVRMICVCVCVCVVVIGQEKKMQIVWYFSDRTHSKQTRLFALCQAAN